MALLMSRPSTCLSWSSIISIYQVVVHLQLEGMAIVPQKAERFLTVFFKCPAIIWCLVQGLCMRSLPSYFRWIQSLITFFR